MVVDKLVERSLRDQRSAVRIQSSANFHVEHLFTVNCTVLKIWKKEKEATNGPFFIKSLTWRANHLLRWLICRTALVAVIFRRRIRAVPESTFRPRILRDQCSKTSIYCTYLADWLLAKWMFARLWCSTWVPIVLNCDTNKEHLFCIELSVEVSFCYHPSFHE